MNHRNRIARSALTPLAAAVASALMLASPATAAPAGTPCPPHPVPVVECFVEPCQPVTAVSPCPSAGTTAAPQGVNPPRNPAVRPGHRHWHGAHFVR